MMYLAKSLSHAHGLSSGTGGGGGPCALIGLHATSMVPSFDRVTELPLAASPARRLDALLALDPSVRWISPDLRVETLARALGLGDLVIRRLRCGNAEFTLAVAGRSTWSDPEGRDRMFALKRATRASGAGLLLVPERALFSEPLSSNALLVAGCRDVRIHPVDRFAVMSGLIEAGGDMPMGDAVGRVSRADDPVAAVLGLAAQRWIGLGLDQVIGPSTRILGPYSALLR